MRLLLVNTRFPESFWSFRWALHEVLPGKRAVNPPLGLATLAALCPPHWQVTIVDENVEPVPLKPDADLIGVCGMGVQFTRQAELLAHYRRLGYPVVAGGSYASLCPERYAPLIKALYDGSAESDISTEVTFEDGRKGVISARVKIRDMKIEPAAATMGEAA